MPQISNCLDGFTNKHFKHNFNMKLGQVRQIFPPEIDSLPGLLLNGDASF